MVHVHDARGKKFFDQLLLVFFDDDFCRNSVAVRRRVREKSLGRLVRRWGRHSISSNGNKIKG